MWAYSLCNKSMQTKNMELYVKSQFKDNYTNFIKKKYITEKSKEKNNLFGNLFM